MTIKSVTSLPVCGRIAIGGQITTPSGVQTPFALNSFIITAQHKREGDWVEHPVAMEVRRTISASPTEDMAPDGRVHPVKWIPIKLQFNDPELNLSVRHEAYLDGRVVCSGNGIKCKRQTVKGALEESDCSGLEMCDHALISTGYPCKILTRMNVQVDVPDSDRHTADPLSSFVFRTAGQNSKDTLIQKLRMFHSLLGGHLRGVKFKLVLHGKTGIDGNLFYYVDILPRHGTLASINEEARIQADADKQMGLDWNAMEVMLRAEMDGAYSHHQCADEFPEIAEFLIGNQLRKSQAHVVESIVGSTSTRLTQQARECAGQVGTGFPVINDDADADLEIEKSLVHQNSASVNFVSDIAHCEQKVIAVQSVVQPKSEPVDSVSVRRRDIPCIRKPANGAVNMAALRILVVNP